MNGSRHDHVFPLVNGNAVTSGAITGTVARRAMESVWAELAAAGFSDWRLGVPFNVHRVPDDDVAAVVYGLPLGCYLQGAASHHRLRVFVEALDLVGMTAESAVLLDGLAATIADDSSFGGIGTGRDWRMWDGIDGGFIPPPAAWGHGWAGATGGSCEVPCRLGPVGGELREFPWVRY